MKSTNAFLKNKLYNEDSCDLYSRNRNIYKFMERLNNIKFRESQYKLFDNKEKVFIKKLNKGTGKDKDKNKDKDKINTNTNKKHRKNIKSLPISINK